MVTESSGRGLRPQHRARVFKRRQRSTVLLAVEWKQRQALFHTSASTVVGDSSQVKGHSAQATMDRLHQSVGIGRDEAVARKVISAYSVTTVLVHQQVAVGGKVVCDIDGGQLSTSARACSPNATYLVPLLQATTTMLPSSDMLLSPTATRMTQPWWWTVTRSHGQKSSQA